MRSMKKKLFVKCSVAALVLLPGLWLSAVAGLANGNDEVKIKEKRGVTEEGLPKVKHMIDTHIHLFDTAREKGVPWPPKDDKVLYKPHLPKEFRQVSRKAGVTGVVIVEASDLVEDNQWVLDLVKGDDYFIGLVGNVDPYRKDFGKQLRKIAKDKRLVGIRARVNDRKIDYRDPQVLKSFKVLSRRNLALDILMNGEGHETVTEVASVAEKLPELRIVVNHVLGYDIDGKLPGKKWIDAVKQLSTHKNVYVKISGLYQRCVPQPATRDIKHYQELLEILWNHFGEDRLVYGSNWPCTKKSGDYTSFVKLVNEYFSAKGQDACEKYFWKNASNAYNLGLK
ncbi:MAG: amidohydrolase family protein [Planctomycetota bacterium]|nr:amidohydrolase family protein [Planctomycetota bacterium]